MAISGNVLRILSDTGVIIDVGSSSGVKRGMKFIIYDEGEMIKDPNTLQELERLQIVKGEVIVNHVQGMFSICETACYNSIQSTMFVVGQWLNSEQIKLNVNKEDVKPLNSADYQVKVGDKVRSIE